VFQYIETFYNSNEIHQTLGYQTPDEFEEQHRETKSQPVAKLSGQKDHLRQAFVFGGSHEPFHVSILIRTARRETDGFYVILLEQFAKRF
jgi:hypothetical protein